MIIHVGYSGGQTGRNAEDRRNPCGGLQVPVIQETAATRAAVSK